MNNVNIICTHLGAKYGDEYVKMIDNSEEVDDLKRNKLVNNFYEFNG